VSPAGRFCGSARRSSAPREFPQTFQVAVEVLSRSLNQAFCSAPRDPGAGRSGALDLHVLHGRRVERLEQRAARPGHARGQVLEPRLVGRDQAGIGA
jgi:hypothetical protein